MFNPKVETIAFRIWQFCIPRAWDVTIAECADGLGISPQYVGIVAGKKDWTNRFRVQPRPMSPNLPQPAGHIGFDEYTLNMR